jgi:hypothetical protein
MQDAAFGVWHFFVLLQNLLSPAKRSIGTDCGFILSDIKASAPIEEPGFTILNAESAFNVLSKYDVKIECLVHYE